MEPRFTASEFRVLLDLWMVMDPWPLGEGDKQRFEALLARDLDARNYMGIVDAYHEHEVTK